MTNGWPVVAIEDALQLQRRWIKLEPDQLYTEIGIRSFGRGVFRKSPVTGLSLGNKRVLRVCPGDLVFNNVFAWEGAVGVASDDESGTIGSHRFVTYTIKNERATARFLQLFFRTEAGLDILRHVSPGSAGRNRTLNLDQFSKQQIALPPLSEQRRIVAKVDQLAERIQDAVACCRSAIEEANHVLRAALRELSGLLKVDGRIEEVLLEKPRNGWSPHCDNDNSGSAVLSLGAVTGFRYSGAECKYTSLPVSKDAHYWLQSGDLLITRSNTPELVGHAAIYDGTPTPCIYSDLMMRLMVNSTKASTQFVWYWLQTPIVREFIARNAKGTSPTMKKISQGMVTAIPFPTSASCEQQRSIVAYLDGLQAKVDTLKALQAQSAADLDALLPSILDKAFKGEL